MGVQVGVSVGVQVGDGGVGEGVSVGVQVGESGVGVSEGVSVLVGITGTNVGVKVGVRVGVKVSVEVGRIGGSVVTTGGGMYGEVLVAYWVGVKKSVGVRVAVNKPVAPGKITVGDWPGVGVVASPGQSAINRHPTQ